MNSVLEERYRRLLRLLPKGYRAQWEEDMVATFLESAYEAYQDDPELLETARPTRGEALSVFGLALRLRLGGVEAPPRPRLLGDATRLVGLILLLLPAAGMGAELVLYAIGTLPLRPDANSYPVGPPPIPLWLTESLRWLQLLWLPAFLCALYGRIQAAWAYGIAALFAAVTARVLWGMLAGGISAPTVIVMVIDLIAVLALAAFHPSAPRPRPTGWLIALAAASAASAGLTLAQLYRLQFVGYVFVDVFDLWCAAYVVAVLLQGLQRRDSSPAGAAWSLALAMLAPGLVALRIGSLAQALDIPDRDPVRSSQILIYSVELAVIGFAGVISLWRCWRAWRELPPAYLEQTD